MTVWNVYYGDRQFARELGDPCLGQVEARTRAEALEKAAEDAEIRARLVQGAGLWVVEEEIEERIQRIRNRGRGR